MPKTKTTYTAFTRVLNRRWMNAVLPTFKDQIIMASNRTGDDDPKWKEKVFNRENATTSLDAVRNTCKGTAGYLEFTEDVGILNVNSDDSGGYQLSVIKGRLDGMNDYSDVVASAEAKAKADYFGQLRKLRTPLQGQVLLGELRETIHMLRHPLLGFYNLYVSLLHARSRRAQLSASDVGNLWLTFRFGVMPLVDDIQAIMSILKRKATIDAVTSYKAFGLAKKATVEVRNYSSVYGVNQSTQIICEYKAYQYIRFGYHTRCASALENQIDAVENSFAKFRDVPATMWELLPMTVFYDYFVNVGSIIEAAFESQENVVWTSVSKILEKKVTFATLAAVPIAASFVVRQFAPSKYQMVSRSVKRRGEPVTVPTVTFGLPRGNIQLTNMAAYLATLLSKRVFKPINERTFL